MHAYFATQLNVLMCVSCIGRGVLSKWAAHPHTHDDGGGCCLRAIAALLESSGCGTALSAARSGVVGGVADAVAVVDVAVDVAVDALCTQISFSRYVKQLLELDEMHEVIDDQACVGRDK